MRVVQSDDGAVTGCCELCYELLCFIQTLSRLTFWITKLFEFKSTHILDNETFDFKSTDIPDNEPLQLLKEILFWRSIVN